MANFDELCHGNLCLRYVKGVLELRKLDFRGLNGQFDVKKAYFRGQIAKIGVYRPILATKIDPWLISRNMSWEFSPKVCWRNSRAQKIRF